MGIQEMINRPKSFLPNSFLPKSLFPKPLSPQSLPPLPDFTALSKNFPFEISGQIDPASPLQGVSGFGTNPGDLKMWMYVPEQIPDRRPLVVVLHGCGQTAAGYNHGAGWSTLADRYGFALLMPEQQRTNNPNGCFNWFQPGDTQRGQGEAASIRQMIETMVRDHAVDPRRVFVTGLSAGGAMTSVMLACYPDVFEAGAIIAGLPYGAAANVQQALQAMSQCPARSPKEWGDAACQAYPGYRGPWPRVSIWHGGADRIVVPNNAREIIKQWTYVHGISLTPDLKDMVDGYPRQLWLDRDGKEVIESYAIDHMAHGTPLSTGDADAQCGAVGPFLLEAGISSSFHIARFFGLVEAGAMPVAARAIARANAESMRVSEAATSSAPASDPAPGWAGLRGARSGIDIGAIINKALTAAGLMK
jgi:poly(hydroxyalkanoate) depolymerase family esterase